MNVKLLDLQAQYLPLRNEIRRAIDEVCDAQSFILGPTVEKFESHLADYCGTRFAIGMSSGTDALLCVLMAMRIGPGDEVICPAFTFFATAGSIARAGAKPVFVDIDPETFNIDPAKIEAKITKRTRAIMPVHLFGQLANMEKINEIARRHGIKVIEDAAQAIGARRHDQPATSLGDCGCLSFFPSKNLGGFGDGGAVCTNDEAFAKQCRIVRVHGGEQVYFHRMVGGNFRLDALQAAVLDVKLKHLDKWHEGRRNNAAMYDRLFAGSGVVTPKIESGNDSIYNQYVIRIPDRDRVKQELADKGIGTAVYYPLSLHLQECFAYCGGRAGDLPESERASREVLALPIYPELDESQIRHVAQSILAAMR